MLKILIVDDERGFHDLMRLMLSSYNAELLYALNGEDAIDLAHDEYPDLIFLDLHLPDVDGFEVLANIPSDIRVCIVSANVWLYDMDGYEWPQQVIYIITKPNVASDDIREVMARFD